MATHRLCKLADAPNHVDLAARWSYEQWGRGMGLQISDSASWFREMIESTSEDTILALVDGVPIAMASLADHDLESRPELKHWLAAVYVEPNFRQRGIAADLVRVVEREAALRGIPLLHLYTNTAEGLYTKLGWTVAEHFDKDGKRFTLMTKLPST